MGNLDLRLALLRGTSGSPLEIDETGRPAPVRMHVQKKSGLSDRLTLNMLNLIANGSLPSGGRLPPERKIAASIKASRVSVRSALDRLKSEGFLTSVQGAGTQLTDRQELLSGISAASRNNMAELAEFIGFFDDLVLGRAMSMADPLEIGRAFADLMVRPNGTITDAFAEFEFRLRLAELSRSAIFLSVVNVLKRGMLSFFDRSMADRLSTEELIRAGQTEAELMGAILRSDAPEASGLMRKRHQMLRDHRLKPPKDPNNRGAGLDEDAILRHLAIEPPEHLRDSVAREIALMIAMGQFEDEGPLLSERRFSELFGVSRATIQEALAQLKSGEVLRSVSAQRARALVPDARMAVNADVSASDLLDLNLIRDYLESWSAAEAAQRMDTQGERSLRRIILEMRRPIESDTRDMNLDLMFHLTIGRLSQNALTLYVSEALRTVVLSYFHVALTNPRFTRRPAAQLLQEHEAIAVALQRRDSQAARQAMCRHVVGFRNEYEEFIKNWAA